VRLGTAESDRGPYVVAVGGELWLDLRELLSPEDPRALDLRLLIADWPAAGPLVSQGIEELRAGRRRGVAQQPERLLPPLPAPRHILCIGRNYRAHALEQGAKVPTAPEIFTRFPSTLVRPLGDIVLPEEEPSADYEAELVAVVGRGGRRIPRAEAMAAVFGWTVGNDVSLRALQYRGSQWTPGKNFDRTAPLGPYVVTRDELPDPAVCHVSLHLEEGEMQSGSASDMIFDVPTLVEDISRFLELLPGDLIFTGTPPGVGEARSPKRYLRPGDLVVTEVSGVGRLENRCVPG